MCVPMKCKTCEYFKIVNITKVNLKHDLSQQFIVEGKNVNWTFKATSLIIICNVIFFQNTLNFIFKICLALMNGILASLKHKSHQLHRPLVY